MSEPAVPEGFNAELEIKAILYQDEIRALLYELFTKLDDFFEQDDDTRNYWVIGIGFPDTGMYELTIRKPDGKTPHDLRLKAEAEVERLRRALSLAVSMIRSGEDMSPQAEAVFREALGGDQ